MAHGIAVIGLNGSGKSTLAHALAKHLGYFEIDAEDYYFPTQRESRRLALDGAETAETALTGVLPFSEAQDESTVQAAMLYDIRLHSPFILSSVRLHWGEELLSHIDIAFWLKTPSEERLRRIQSREEKRFGARVRDGGDMCGGQALFREMAARRDELYVETSIREFSRPIVMLDGMLSIEKNIENVLNELTFFRR